MSSSGQECLVLNGNTSAAHMNGALTKYWTCRTAAKSGKSVLHIDQAKNYGAAWSSLTLDEILAWSQQHSTSSGTSADLPPAALQPTADQQLQHALHISAQDGQSQLYSNVELYQQHENLGPSREYSIDLAGKAGTAAALIALPQLPCTQQLLLQVVFCSSDAICTVLAFGVQNYLEFKLIQGR